jgi:hypothetical protein
MPWFDQGDRFISVRTGAYRCVPVRTGAYRFIIGAYQRVVGAYRFMMVRKANWFVLACIALYGFVKGL